LKKGNYSKMSENYKEKYLSELARKYPDSAAAECEIIKLRGILNLPKGTEHFISDLHGEAEALSHLLRNASGVIKRKLQALFGKELSTERLSELATLIYYPEEKQRELLGKENLEEYFIDTIPRLVALCRLAGRKYTRSKVRARVREVSGCFHELICELISADGEAGKIDYFGEFYESALRSERRFEFISALCSAIKALVVDKLHVVGDIFDRGARADLVMDELMRQGSIDFQWGNHDVLWMGAAAGSEACVAEAVANSLAYGNLEILEIGYGISLLSLSEFARATYLEKICGSDLSRLHIDPDEFGEERARLIFAMHKAISIIAFKLEGQLIERNPSFEMDGRRLLHKIDIDSSTVEIDDEKYPLRDNHFPTISAYDPYKLTKGERAVILSLTRSFSHSERLKRHIDFLYERGSMYKIANGNLLFHGCIPLDENSELLKLPAAGGLSGRALMDYCDKTAREGYFSPEGSEARAYGKDYLWFLGRGKNSPLTAREKTTTFERLFLDDKQAQKEPRNAYYKAWENRKISEMILNEFGLSGKYSHIINGHIPVKKSENPIKDGGKLILIDGGFCSAYHKKTGIGGYTLIYNAEGMRIAAHAPFSGRDMAIKKNEDILSDVTVFEITEDKIKVKDTDEGKQIMERISDLGELISLFKTGSKEESSSYS